MSQPQDRTDGEGARVDAKVFAGPDPFELPVGCARVDRGGSVTWTNAAWAASGLSICVDLGEAFLDAVGRSASLSREQIEPAVRGTEARASVDTWVDGRIRVRIMVLRDAEGATVVVHDLPTPASVPQGDANEQMLQRIVATAMDGIITIDERGVIVTFNAAAERMFGVGAEEALGSRLDRFLPERERKAHDQHVHRFGATGVSSRAMGNLGVVSGMRANGDEFAMEASISQVRVGDRRYFSAILRDITERKRLEAQLLQAQKMEGVGRLAGGIAHDFNNLLMAIFNYLALASRRLGPEHPVSHSLGQAHQAAQRAAELTRQLLTFARQQVAAPKTLCLRDVVAGMTRLLERLIGDDVKLVTVLASDTGCVKADPAQLEQVLVNLVVNARDAMPMGGTITIETRNEHLDDAYCRMHLEATPGEHVVLCVSDTGSGMTPEIQARIFEPFFTTKPVGKGTGLGLSTCHGIVKQVGGHMGVYSEAGRGTAMRMYLPRVMDAASSGHELRETPPAPGGTETILLAEDSGLVRELLAEELRNHGYTVLTASCGPDALRVSEKYPGHIDLLLTDVVMPEMSGVQLARKLLESRPIPVIYMSGYTDETITHHGVDPREVPFIAKPVMTDTLLHFIHKVLRERVRGGSGG